jgi:hypothetical protein
MALSQSVSVFNKETPWDDAQRRAKIGACDGIIRRK